jgi:hypothetical protein
VCETLAELWIDGIEPAPKNLSSPALFLEKSADAFNKRVDTGK